MTTTICCFKVNNHKYYNYSHCYECFWLHWHLCLKWLASFCSFLFKLKTGFLWNEISQICEDLSKGVQGMDYLNTNLCYRKESQAGNSGKKRRVTDGTIVLAKVQQFPHWPGKVIFLIRDDSNIKLEFSGPGLQPWEEKVQNTILRRHEQQDACSWVSRKTLRECQPGCHSWQARDRVAGRHERCQVSDREPHTHWQRLRISRIKNLPILFPVSEYKY